MAADSTNPDFLGPTLQAIEAEQRTVRAENELIRAEMERFASREEVLDMVKALSDRIAAFEAHVDRRFDQLASQLAEFVRAR